ncbi:DUF6968 family protein [Nocardia nova]|uniref:DUF6968 family protein n=1 Tax=Nocardia nova TaxID=37330 RepID=UPI0033E93E95
MSGWDQLVIAARELRMSGEPLVVSIGLPYQDGLMWLVPVRIEGAAIEGPIDETAHGNDSVEALVGALEIIAAVLNSWNSDSAVTWNGETDLGFSR